MESYPARAMERAMKIQEVILRAVDKRILWSEAAEIIGISYRSMQRWRERYQEYGYDGLFDRRLRRPSPKRVPLVTVEKVLRLYREQYFDFNVRHFVEKLHNEHGVELSYTWVKTALQTAGLVKKSRKRGKHRKKRSRRPLPGMMTAARMPGWEERRDKIWWRFWTMPPQRSIMPNWLSKRALLQ